MRKFLILLCSLFLITGCSFGNSSKIKYIEIETYRPDMSKYMGLNTDGHNFTGTTVKELKRVIDEEASGIFVLSREGCDHCQMVMQYLNEVAIETDNTIYYIDATSNEYPIQGTENYELLYQMLYDFLGEGDGERQLQTPHVIVVVNGYIKESKIGTTWTGLNYDEDDVKELKDLYRKMFSVLEK